MASEEPPALTGGVSVSAVLLCYNCEDYIGEALQSALDQDCPPMQLIVSDDASTDGTVDIVQSILASYRGPHRTEFYQRPINSGSKSAHLNNVFPRATGELIISFDGDDISGPYRVSRIRDAFLKNPDAYAVYSSYSLIDETGRQHGAGNVPHPGKGESASTWFARVDSYAAGTTLAVRREVVDKFGPIDPEINEDIVLPFRASLLGDVVFLNEELVRARRHGTSLTTDLDRFESLTRYRERIELGIERARHHKASRFADIRTATALMPDRSPELLVLESVVLDSIAMAESSARLVSPSLVTRLTSLLLLWKSGAYRDERLRQVFLALAPRLYLRYKRHTLQARRKQSSSH
jgi:glycosyltransferase involved in cell wall biosynthesis